MKKLLVAGAALTALIGTPALAADMALKAAPPPPAPVCIWCGFYIGANAGGSWDNNDTATYLQPATPGTASSSLNNSSFAGGGQIGYNWQWGAFVLGGEADIQGRDRTASANGLLPFAGNVIDQVNLSQTDKWFGTFRAKAGVAAGNALFYVTGGGAYGEIDHSYTEIRVTTGQARTLSDSQERGGWSAGGGIEYMVWKNVSIGAEYLYIDLGNDTLVNPASVSAGLPFPTSQASFKNTSNVVRAKLNWHFN
jgi:outer membrane immunogenic protein